MQFEITATFLKSLEANSVRLKMSERRVGSPPETMRFSTLSFSFKIEKSTTKSSKLRVKGFPWRSLKGIWQNLHEQGHAVVNSKVNGFQQHHPLPQHGRPHPRSDHSAASSGDIAIFSSSASMSLVCSCFLRGFSVLVLLLSLYVPTRLKLTTFFG